MLGHDEGPTDRLPLAGLKLCCTSIPVDSRSAIARSAIEMGATHSLDLTSDVTHLVVGRIDTPKYAYVAKERPDIRVLQPGFIDAVKARWMNGEDVRAELPALEEQYRCPTFWGLRICVTGFSDLDLRQSLTEAIEAGDGEYCGDLRQSVTHLVAKEPAGKKYEFALQWQQKIVGVEWIWRSVQRGMALEEGLFAVTLPAESRGVGAVKVEEVRGVNELGKRTRGEEQGGPIGRRKMRRVATETLGERKDEVWADIGGRQIDVGARTAQHANATDAADETTLEVDESILNPPVERKLFESDPLKDFSGNFIVYGFDRKRTDLVHNFLLSNGGTIIDKSEAANPDDTSTVVVVVPHTSQPSQVEQLQFDLPIRSRIVTEWWVEECLHGKELIDVQNTLCRPFATFPIQGFQELTICPTSFTGVDLLHLSKAVTLMGATYDETLRPTTSVLVCNETSKLNREKLRYAVEKSIPIVSSQWLIDCIARGSIMPMTEYSIAGPREGDILRHMFWHPAHNLRPKPKPRKGLSRHQAVEVMARGEGFSKHNELDTQKRANKDDSRVVQEPLLELPREMNSPKKKMPSAELQKKHRPKVPFDDDDDDDDNAQYQYQDDTINTFNDDEPAPQEVEDSIAQSEIHNVPSSPTNSSPLPTLPPMPTIPSFDASASITVPPAQPPEPTADPTPTQNTTRLNNTLAELLNTHKARQHKKSQPASEGTDAPPVVSVIANGIDGTTDPPDLQNPPPTAGGVAAAPRLRTHTKARTLGRAPSNPSSLLTRLSTTTSNSSASAALSRPTSALAAAHPSLSDRADSENLDDLDAALFRPRKPDPDAALFRPSQALSYDNPEAGKALREMARVFGEGIGGQMDGGGDDYDRERENQAKRRMRVEEIGVVRDKLDAEEDGSTGGRKGKGSGARNTRSKRREKVGL